MQYKYTTWNKLKTTESREIDADTNYDCHQS